MPSIKRSGIKSQAVKTGFEAYDGPEPTKRGMYRARITRVKARTARTGTPGLMISIVLVAGAGDPKNHKQFDEYPITGNVWFGDKEQMITRENNFYAALGAKDEPNIVHEDGDMEKGGAGAVVKTIGGVNPVGKIINADIKPGRDQDGNQRLEIDGFYVCEDKGGKAAPAVADDVEDEDDDILEDEVDEETEETEVEEQTREEREAELNASTLAALKTLASSDYDLTITGLKKAGIVQTILDYEYSEEDKDDTPMAIADDPEEDEEVDEEPEDDEEEEDEEDERAARQAELASLDRVRLKALLKAADPEAKVYKSTTDDALREAVLAAEFGEDELPF